MGDSSVNKFMEDLLNANEEMAFEFTQDQWEEALIYGFRKDLSMSGVLAKASGLTRQIIGDEWQKLASRAEKLKPSFNPNSSGRNRARVWIANNALFARDSLWEGNYERAKKILRRGGIGKSALVEVRRECKKEQKKDMSGKILIKARDIDKRHDWKTVK